MFLKFITNYITVVSALITIVLFFHSDWSGWARLAVLGGLVAIFTVIFWYIQTNYMGLRTWSNIDATASVAGRDFTVTHRPTEAMAKLTDAYVKRAFGKTPVRHATYAVWRRKNPFLLTCVLDEGGEMVGFFDVFPLVDWAGDDLQRGSISEKDLTIDEIYSAADDNLSNCVHIATLYCRIRDQRDRYLSAYWVTIHMYDFIFNRYPPREGRVYSAYAYTPEGETALKRNGFRLHLDEDQTTEAARLYVLDCQNANITMERFRKLSRRLDS